MVLPNGTGKTAKVLVFTKGENVDKAKEAGAEYVGGPEFAEKIRRKTGSILTSSSRPRI